MKIRRITSKHEEQKLKKRNQWIIGIILIGIMLLSLFGSGFYMFSENNQEGSNENTMNYNGLEFINKNGLWFLTLDGSEFVFKNSPKEIVNIEITGELKLLNNYYGRPLYVYSEDQESELEIYLNLNNIAQRIQNACFEGFNNSKQKCDESLPIKNCKDNFIIIQEKNSSNIIQEDNCVFIYSPLSEMLKTTDEFLFNVLEVK